MFRSLEDNDVGFSTHYNVLLAAMIWSCGNEYISKFLGLGSILNLDIFFILSYLEFSNKSGELCIMSIDNIFLRKKEKVVTRDRFLLIIFNYFHAVKIFPNH